MVSIRARELLFKTNFQIWQSGGEEKAFQGASPLPPLRGLQQLVEGYEDVLGRRKIINQKKTQKRFGLLLAKKRNPDPKKPRGFCNRRPAKRGWRRAQPLLGGDGAGASQKEDGEGHRDPSPHGSRSPVLSVSSWGFFPKLSS